jgi:hypothetical protein
MGRVLFVFLLPPPVPLGRKEERSEILARRRVRFGCANGGPPPGGQKAVR